jgi:ankyrin repeat protein
MSTPLHRAAQQFDLAEVSRLLAAGASASPLDAQGRTPLDLICALGDPSFSPYELAEIGEVEAALRRAGAQRAADLPGLP